MIGYTFRDVDSNEMIKFDLKYFPVKSIYLRNTVAKSIEQLNQSYLVSERKNPYYMYMPAIDRDSDIVSDDVQLIERDGKYLISNTGKAFEIKGFSDAVLGNDSPTIIYKEMYLKELYHTHFFKKYFLDYVEGVAICPKCNKTADENV